jgi:pimeloyl-ACP methyl ester carboxylesterase/quercetin dioxygenase-like cupin family protein
MRILFALIVAVFFAAAGFRATALGHEYSESEFTFSCDIAEIVGTMTRPGHRLVVPGGQEQHKRVCLVIIGGTLSNTRDGGMAREGVPERSALKRLARSLALAGYSSIRYDKTGYGKSKPKQGWRGSYSQEAQVAAAAIEFARQQDRVDKVVAVAESAGAYLACLAAKAGTRADGYVFLGGHCDSGQAIYEYNFGRLAALVDEKQEWKDLAEQRLRFELALGRTYKPMFEAAARGESTFTVVDGDFTRTMSLERRKEEVDMPPDAMFRFIKAPTLALSGEHDLNVPADHAARIVSVLRKAGNHDCTCVLVPKADHNFQIGPETPEERLRERYTFDSFRRDYSPQLDSEMARWLDSTFGYAASTKLPTKVESAAVAAPRAATQVERDPKTEFTPERVFLAPGIQIVRDITDKNQTTGVPTLEGEIGPLLLGTDSQAHFIDMPAGIYCEEHPHSSESIIYTVRGQWVLCSHGRRHVMKPGTLFHFAPNTPTGYEVPFSENAFILIFKGQRLTANERDFINYLQGMAKRLEQEHQAGVPYLLNDLPDDHPAKKFAAELKSK